LPNISGVHQLEKEEKESHVAYTEEKQMYTFHLENLNRTAHMEYLGVVRAQPVIRGRRTERLHKAPKFGGRRRWKCNKKYIWRIWICNRRVNKRPIPPAVFERPFMFSRVQVPLAYALFFIIAIRSTGWKKTMNGKQFCSCRLRTLVCVNMEMF